MTHATKAIYRWMLSDYIKVSNIATESMLYTEADLEASMEKIETINFHEERDIMGVRFWAYNGESYGRIWDWADRLTDGLIRLTEPTD